MSTFNYRLKISYDGSGYEGWQVQPAGHKTIQGELNKALAKVSKSDEVSSLGSGRTDSGVHALAQIVKVRAPLEIESQSLMRALNSHLPKEIRVLDSSLSNDDFHPVRDAKWKRYNYILGTNQGMPPHLRNYVSPAVKDVDWSLVEKALKLFEGEHDFVNFSTKGTEVSTTVRTVFLTRLETMETISAPGSSEKVVLKKMTFEGSGFLKQMVRLLVGTALAAGQNKVNEQEILEHLKSPKSTKLAAVSPPQGLYLEHVEYDLPHPLAH